MMAQYNCNLLFAFVRRQVLREFVRQLRPAELNIRKVASVFQVNQNLPSLNLPNVVVRRRYSTSTAMTDYVPIIKRRVEITETGPFAENDFKSKGMFSDSEMHQLTVGGPGPTMLRQVAGILSRAAQKRMGEEEAGEADLLQYGNSFGDPLCRLELAKFLSEGYGSPVQVEDLLLTGGATQALAYILSLFFKAGDTVFVEDPTYFINLAAFDEAQMKSIAIPMDSEGIDADALEVRLKKFKESDEKPLTPTRPFRAMLYLITVFHNPTTMSYSAARCRRIIELARKYDVLAVTDDVYNVLSWGPSAGDANSLALAPPRLVSYDKKDDPDYKGHVISCGTFSKFMCPGARLGWFETAPALIDIMRKSAYLVSGGNFNTVMSGIMGAALEMGLVQEHLNRSRKVYAHKARALWKTLKDGMPEEVTIGEPTGGYFLWIELPKGSVADDLLELAKGEYKIAFLAGQRASPCGNFTNCVRLSFSFYEHADLQKAAVKFIAATRKYLGK